MKKSPECSVNDATRHVTLRDRDNPIVHKFTPEGVPVDESNFNPRRDLSRLSRDDLKLLAALQEKKWDLEGVCRELGLDVEKSKKRYKKISYFKFEEERCKALAAIANPDWIAAKHVENVFNGGQLEDSEHKSLQELAKIEGAYKQVAPSTQLNIWNIQLSPEHEQKLKGVYDTMALEENHAA